MMRPLFAFLVSPLLISIAALAQNSNYVQTNLVADVAGVANNTDPNLTGLWGISASPTSPFWVSNAYSGTSTLYNGAGTPFPAAGPIVVNVPPGASGGLSKGTPTGQVNNGTGGFMLDNARPASFIFATLDGTISAWNTGTDAILKVDNSADSSYTGLAIAISSYGPTLYAANVKKGTIDTFDTNFKPLQVGGTFSDPDLPPGLAPFNVQRFGQSIFVTYTMPSPATRYTAGPGTGAVDVYDMDGYLLGRIATQGVLNAPWGLALAPGQFGKFSYMVLVGNFGDGTISAFDPYRRTYLGTMMDGKGKPITIPGLWGLQFGSGSTNGGDAITLYFAADGDGTHGLFGSLRPAADSIQP